MKQVTVRVFKQNERGYYDSNTLLELDVPEEMLAEILSVLVEKLATIQRPNGLDVK